jgi:hypothetical protein
MRVGNVFALFDSNLTSSSLLRHAVKVRMQHRWRILQIMPACCATRYETRRWHCASWEHGWAQIVAHILIPALQNSQGHRHQGLWTRKVDGVLLHETWPSLGWIFLSASASASPSHLSTRRTLRGLLAARLTPSSATATFADPHRVQRISLLGLPRALNSLTEREHPSRRG